MAPFSMPSSSYGGSIVISFRQTMALIGALLTLQLLHLAVFLTQSVRQRLMPPRRLTAAIDGTELRIMEICTTVMPTLRVQPRCETVVPTLQRVHTAATFGRPVGPHSLDGSAMPNSTSPARDLLRVSLRPAPAGRVKIFCEPPGNIKNMSYRGSVMPPPNTVAATSPYASLFSSSSLGDDDGLADAGRQNPCTSSSRPDAASVSHESTSGSLYSSPGMGSAKRGPSASSGDAFHRAMPSAAQYAKLVRETPPFGSFGLQSKVSLLQTDSAQCDLDPRASCRSNASYPSRFPVSDGLAYSSLATAS